MNVQSSNGDIAFSRPFFGTLEAEAASETVLSGWVVGGPRLNTFEERFARVCGARYAVGVSSWTAGAFLVLHSWNIGPGDEVIVPSLTFIATVNVIRHVGATPVFAEIDAHTFNIDPLDVARKITARTKVIMPVDQIGLPCDIDAIVTLAEQHNLFVLDDAACAFASTNAGRPIGSLADVTVFSLHARKVITTGEGGMIVTDDGELARRLRRLRQQGMSASDFIRHSGSPTLFETYPEIGFNYRITDIQAAIGLVQLDRLQEILRRRKAIAASYSAGLKGHPFLSPPIVPLEVVPNWQSYQVVLTADAPLTRNAAMDRLYMANIPTRRGVMASHRETPYHDIPAILPITERVADASLQLPMHPQLDDQQIARVLEVLWTLD